MFRTISIGTGTNGVVLDPPRPVWPNELAPQERRREVDVIAYEVLEAVAMWVMGIFERDGMGSR